MRPSPGAPRAARVVVDRCDDARDFLQTEARRLRAAAEPEVTTRWLTPSPRKSASARTLASRRAFSDRKSTRLNSSHSQISYAVFCLKKEKMTSATHSCCLNP